jgi:hypothetical protein
VEEAPETGKKLLQSAHANGMNVTLGETQYILVSQEWMTDICHLATTLPVSWQDDVNTAMNILGP